MQSTSGQAVDMYLQEGCLLLAVKSAKSSTDATRLRGSQARMLPPALQAQRKKRIADRAAGRKRRFLKKYPPKWWQLPGPMHPGLPIYKEMMAQQAAASPQVRAVWAFGGHLAHLQIQWTAAPAQQ